MNYLYNQSDEQNTNAYIKDQGLEEWQNGGAGIQITMTVEKFMDRLNGYD
jgi:hypothetical protein